MLGHHRVELTAELRIIEPGYGTSCGCGFELRKVGDQIIKRLSYEPARAYVIEK